MNLIYSEILGMRNLIFQKMATHIVVIYRPEGGPNREKAI